MSILKTKINKPVRIYVDFDGTISKTDVKNFMLNKYADPVWLKIEKYYLKGKISSFECLRKQISLLRGVSNVKY